MKKMLLSMSVTLAILLAFGLAVFMVVSRPAGEGANIPKEAPVAAQAQAAPPVAAQAQAVAYEISEPDYAWVEVSSDYDHQIVATDFEDNLGSAAIDIGFYFPFFDNLYDQLYVSDNGYIYFGGDETRGRSTPQTVPSASDTVHNLIAPLGADLFRNPADSAVYIARQTEPERRLVIQFENAYWCCNLEYAATFQILLYPDGRILTQYQPLSGDDAPPVYATIGLEDEDGAHGHNLYTGFLDETDVLGGEKAVLYDPGQAVLGRLHFLPAAVTAEVEAGQSVTMTTDLLNLSGLEQTLILTYTRQVSHNGQILDTTDWKLDILTQPATLASEEFGPLTVTVNAPDTAAAGETADFTFTVQADDFAAPPPTARFTVTAEQ